jgi:hypothetical protein
VVSGSHKEREEEVEDFDLDLPPMTLEEAIQLQVERIDER